MHKMFLLQVPLKCVRCTLCETLPKCCCANDDNNITYIQYIFPYRPRKMTTICVDKKSLSTTRTTTAAKRNIAEKIFIPTSYAIRQIFVYIYIVYTRAKTKN